MERGRETAPPARRFALLAPAEKEAAVLPAGPPILIVAVDTEAEFDWTRPFSRGTTSVRNLRQQRLAQAIYDRFGLRPVYLVDYAVASQAEGYLPLREIAQSGGCEIGAHLHPWITPPFEEELSDRNSFSHNLPVRLQKEKLARLTDAIAANLAIAPACYRAGRYGVGEEIAGILKELGYRIDMSVLSGIDMRRIHGQDFRRGRGRPYWFGDDGGLLEIPATSCFAGVLTRKAFPESLAVQLYARIARPSLDRLHLRGALARRGLLCWTPLSPEGVAFDELRRASLILLSRGHRVFVLSYHSSSLLPGSTEYVRSSSDLSNFLGTMEQYIEFFFGEIGGISMTPSELWRALLKQRETASIPAVLE